MALDNEDEFEPSSCNEAVTCADRSKWIAAMNDEMNSLCEIFWKDTKELAASGLSKSKRMRVVKFNVTKHDW